MGCTEKWGLEFRDCRSVGFSLTNLAKGTEPMTILSETSRKGLLDRQQVQIPERSAILDPGQVSFYPRLWQDVTSKWFCDGS